MRAASTVSQHLSVEAIRAVRLVGPGATRIERVMIDWFTSPFWLGETDIASWFDGGKDFTRVVPRVTPRVVESELAAHIRAAQIRDVSTYSGSPESPCSLVDRYLVDLDAGATLADLRALTTACLASSTTHALIWFEDGVVVSASVPSFFAIIVVDSIRSCVTFPVDHGIRRLLGSSRQRRLVVPAHRRPILPQGATVVGVDSLLPTITGMALRTNLVTSPASGVPVTLYPLLAALVPEISGDLVPLIRPKGLVHAPTSSVPIWPVSSFGAVMWSLSLMMSSPAGRMRRLGRRLGVWVLRRAHPIARTVLAVRVFAWFGIDSTTSRGLVTRLRFGPGTNPWLTARERKSAGIQIAPADDVVTVGGDRGYGINRDVEVAPW